MADKYIRCTRCLMDNLSDDTITFDSEGCCSYCNNAIERGKRIYFPDEEGSKKLSNLFNKIKEESTNKKYDCLMGISGGLDSSYLAYLGYKWGLRILAVHIDDGFDTDITKSNIDKLCKKCNIELSIIKPDAEQFNDLTRAFFLSGVPNVAMPQDNILFAELYKKARNEKIKYFLSGGNYSLECILQNSNTCDAFDIVNIKDIHRKFGRKPIDKLEMISDLHRLIDNKIYGIKSIRPLDYIDYNKEQSLKELHDFCEFEYYGSKHLENELTAFIQLYWFYKRFNVDKRKSHLSSMIISNQMTKEQALELMNQPLFDEEIMEHKIDKILKQLDLDRKLFEEAFNQPLKQHSDYRTSKAVERIRRLVARFRR